MKTVFKNIIPYIPILGIILVLLLIDDEYFPLNNNLINITSALMQGVSIVFLFTKFVF